MIWGGTLAAMPMLLRKVAEDTRAPPESSSTTSLPRRTDRSGLDEK